MRLRKKNLPDALSSVEMGYISYQHILASFTQFNMPNVPGLLEYIWQLLIHVSQTAICIPGSLASQGLYSHIYRRGLNAIHPQHYTPILSSYNGAWHKGVSGSLYHQKFWALQCYGCVPQPPPGAHHQDRISQFVSYFFLVGYFRYLALANKLAGCQLVSRLYIRRSWRIVVIKQEEP